MKHDLDLINAALCLGDNFSFPVGVIVIDKFGNRLRVLRAGFTAHMELLMRIVHVPENAPPFFEWPRCEVSEVKLDRCGWFQTNSPNANDGSPR